MEVEGAAQRKPLVYLVEALGVFFLFVMNNMAAGQPY